MKKLIFGMALIGMGSFAMAQQVQPTPQQRAERQAKRVEMQKQNEAKRAQHLAEMEKELGLDKTQVAQIKAIQDRNQAERKAENQRNMELRKQKMEVMKKKKQDMDNEMRRILTPEQYQKWEAKKQARMQERKEKFQNRKDDFGGMKKHRMHKKINTPPAG